MHEPFTSQEQRKNARESRKKPSVEVEMHGGIKNENWPFTRHVLELSCHQNALPMHGRCYFLELVVNCRRTSELRSCMKMRSCGAAYLRSSIRQKIKVLNFENGFWVFLKWGFRSLFVYAPCPFLMIYTLFIANHSHKLALLLLQSKIPRHLCWILSLKAA